MGWIVRAVALLAGLVLAFTTLPAQAWAPTPGATFNVPLPWGGKAARTQIIRKVEAAIRNAQPGSVVLITSYLMDRSESVDAMIGACRRGVSVRVILDGDVNTSEARRLVTTLNADNLAEPDAEPRRGPCNTALPGTSGTTSARMTDRQVVASVDDPLESPVQWGADRSYVHRCATACRSNSSAMHSKFYAFSHTGTALDVVMASSSNLNSGGANLGWNDMITLVGRPQAFLTYLEVHRAMTEERRAGSSVVESIEGNAVHRFYPVIGGTRATDPVLADLNRVGCRSDFGRTQVRVQMFSWWGTRGNYLADKLFSLARSGCRVSVIVGAPGREIMDRLRGAARRGLIALYDSRWEFPQDFHKGKVDIRTHGKHFMVRGRIDGDPSATLVSAGSMNWTNGALRYGDENTMNVSNPAIHSAYLNHFNRVRRHSRRVR